MCVLVVDGGGHLTYQSRKELTYLCIVLLEELLSCGCCLLDGADGGFACGMYCGDYGIGGRGGGRFEFGQFLEPRIEGWP